MLSVFEMTFIRRGKYVKEICEHICKRVIKFKKLTHFLISNNNNILLLQMETVKFEKYLKHMFLIIFNQFFIIKREQTNFYS